MAKKDIFAGLIGQDTLKSKLNFYKDAQKASGTLPFLLFNGAKGLGKTEFAKAFAKSLDKQMIEINCSSIRNAEQFFEQIFVPHVLDKDITIFLDEAHALPKDLEMAFLTIFNVEGAKTKRFNFAGSSYLFDFQRQTFMFATTELDKLFPPFKDRLTQLDFESYREDQLGKIIEKKLDWINFSDGVIEDVCKTVRGNARSAIKIALDIERYANVKHKSSFTKKDWLSLCKLIGILPFGMNATELQVLKILNERGACSLQMLCAVTGMSRTAIQKDAEVYLLKTGFMKIDGKREITGKGLRALEILNQC